MARRKSRRFELLETTEAETEAQPKGIGQVGSYPDILRIVFLLADTKTQGRCLRVSRSFFDMVGPAMYRYLELRYSPGPDHHHPLNGAGITRTGEGGSTRAETTSRQDDLPGPATPVYDFKTRLLALTRVAKWEPNPVMCGQFKECELRMPNLRVLQMHTRGFEGQCTFPSRTVCPLWEQFSAPKVVVVTHTFLGDEIHGPMPSRENGYMVKKLVLKKMSPSHLSSLNPTLHIDQLEADHLVVLFIPWPGQTKFRLVRLPQDRRPPDRVAQQIFDRMGDLCAVATGIITFVNAGFIDHYLLALPEGTSTQAAQDHIEKQVRRSVSQQNLAPDERREEILGKVKFVGMKEYLQENDWEGELDPAEAERWLQ